ARELAGVVVVHGAWAAVGEALPALADADHLPARLAAAVDDGLDDRVEAGHVTAAGEDADAARLHHPTMPHARGTPRCTAEGSRVTCRGAAPCLTNRTAAVQNPLRPS